MTAKVDLQIEVGDLRLEVAFSAEGTTALVGPNGAGKTTLLRALVGAHRPVGGTLELEGRPLFDLARGLDVSPEHRRIGYVPQGRSLFPHLDVLDNVAFGLRERAGRRERRARAASLLADMGCAELASRPVPGLSGGEAQRVALARALMVEPALLLLDEPLSALDAGARRELRTFLAARFAEGARPVIVVTHDPRDIRALAARVVVLEGGRVVQSGPPEALAARPATPFVAELFDVA